MGAWRGDLNDIRSSDEKNGGRRRSKNSCKGFREFIASMKIEEIRFQDKQWTWANNWEDEGYIEVRLDRFFGAPIWFWRMAIPLCHMFHDKHPITAYLF